MATPVTQWNPVGPGENEAVREQLARILAHTSFKTSKRSSALFRYIVESSLSPTTGVLKERVIGVEVFGRVPGYDTGVDPIVRATASEVRKRIAQYYHESGHEHELRIDLPSGSYAAVFQIPDALPDEPPGVAAPPAISPVPGAAERLSRRFATILVLVCAGAAALLGYARWSNPAPAIDRFWGPILASQAPVLVSIGQPVLGPGAIAAARAAPVPDSKSDGSLLDHEVNGEPVALSDAVALSQITHFLGQRGKPFSLRGAAGTSLADLRQGPAVLIALGDNPWTMRALASLRFRVRFFNGEFGIEDSQKPGTLNWTVDLRAPYSKLTRDYGIVARFLNPQTGQPTVIAAGIGENGTIAAGEFVANPSWIEQLSRGAPRGWEKENIEAVIGTQVIGRESGPPRVLVVDFWQPGSSRQDGGR